MDRHSRTLRAFAALFTAYLALASGRALIPGLCATLAGLEEERAICVSPDHACCQPAADPGEAQTKLVAPHNHCAFCNLAHAAARTESVPAIELPVPAQTRLAGAHDVYVPNPSGADAYLRRGPPIA